MRRRDGEAASVPVRPRRVPDATALRRARAVLVPRRRHLLGVAWLVLDRSTSMGDPGKMRALRDGADRFFVEAVRRSHAVGAVAFANDAEVVCGAGIDARRFRARLDALRPFGCTRMEAGFDRVAAKLRYRGGVRTALLLTDGAPDDPEAALRSARTLRALGVRLLAVGTGDADEAFLRALTGAPELAWTVPRPAAAEAMAGAARTLGRPAEAEFEAEVADRDGRAAEGPR